MYVFPHRIIAWVLLIVAVGLAIVASSTSMWYKGETGPLSLKPVASLAAKGSLGPFRACVTITSDVIVAGKLKASGCVATGKAASLSPKLQTVRAMTIISIISAALAVLLCGLSHAEGNDGEAVRSLHGIAVFFGWLAGVAGAIAVGVFASIKHLSSGLKWGYTLMCVSTVLSFIGAIMITAPAIPAVDLEPSAPAGETIASAAIAGATGTSVGTVTAVHEDNKAHREAVNHAEAARAPHSAKGEAAAADHAAAVEAGVAEPSPKPLK